MAARSIEARLVISGEDKASAEIAKVVKALKETEKASGFSDKVGRLAKAFSDVERQAKAAQGVLDARGPLERTVKNLAAAERQTARLGRELDGARKAADEFGKASAFAKGSAQAEQAARLSAEVKRIAEAHRGAEREVTKLTKAFAAETSVLRKAEAEASRLGADLSGLERHQARLAQQTDLATRALRQQIAAEEQAGRTAAARQTRRDAWKGAAGIVGLSAVHRAERFGHSTVETYREFDKYSRQTKAFGNFSDAEMEKIVDMAIHKSAGTKFNDIQWLEGAKALGGRGVKAGSVMGILPEASNYGQAMSTTLPEAVAGLEGALFAFQRDLSTPERARAAARRTSDIQVAAAKSFGLTHDDLKGGYQYGALAASSSGISEEKLLAFIGLGKKLNISGDAQGNAFNTMVAKILSPDQKGREALAAMGINIGKFQSMPKALSLDNFGSMIAQQYGVKLNGAARERLGRSFSDQSTITDPNKFAVAVREALKGQVGINGAKDLNKVAGSAERFRRNNVQKVDADGLFNEIMHQIQGGNIALANSIFGPKQARRIMAAIRDEKLWDESVAKVEHTPDGKAEGVAEEMMGGFEGAASRFENAIKNLETKIGRAWDNDGKGGALTSITDKAAHLVQSMAELDNKFVQVGSAAAAVGSGLVAIKSLGLLASGFGLPGSSARLDAAAVNLNAAASKLAGGAPGDSGDKPKKKGGRLGMVGNTLGLIGLGPLAEAAEERNILKMPDGSENLRDSVLGFLDPNAPALWRKYVHDEAKTIPSMSLPRPSGPMTVGSGGLTAFGLTGPNDPEKVGKEAGSTLAESIGDGLKQAGSTVIEQGTALYERLKKVFQDGIKVPVTVAPGDGLSGAIGVDGIAGSAGGDTLGGGLGAGTGSGRGGLRRLGGGGGSVVPNGEAGPGTGTGDSWYEAVMRAEGTAGKDPYNVVLGKGKYGLPSKPLTDMTLAEAYRFGRSVRARHGASSALGAFQIVGRTMKEHMKHTGLGWDDKFSPENQRKLADSIRQREGWGAWEGLKIHRGELARARRGSGVIADAPGKPEIPNPIPQAPPGGLGRGSGDLGAAADRMAAAAARMENANFYGRVDVAVSADSGLKAQAKQMRSSGTMTADMGVSMPDLRRSGRDWA